MNEIDYIELSEVDRSFLIKCFEMKLPVIIANVVVRVVCCSSI